MAAAACTTTALAASSSSLGMEGLTSRIRDRTDMPRRASVVVRAAAKDEERKGQGPEEPEKKSLFTSLTDALDFAAVRSDKDAELLQDASSATKSGERMSREQYGALRRKVGGTYRDFFKDFVDGENSESTNL